MPPGALLQIAVPTRTEVPEYQKLRSTVHEIVGRINGKFGTLTTVPIHHLDRQVRHQIRTLPIKHPCCEALVCGSLVHGMGKATQALIHIDNWTPTGPTAAQLAWSTPRLL